MEQMLMAIHAKDTLEMLEELIENSDTERIDRKKLLDIIRRSPDMFFEDDSQKGDIFYPRIPVLYE